MPQVKVIQPLSEPSKKLRVAAYARVSSDSADQLNSFATQVDYYTGYIQSKDEWEFAGLYADEAISGITADKRSDFQRLLVDCHAGKIDRILVKSISRFARNLPIYHTVAESSLQKGAGHMPGTSLPIGGKSTHAVISAHSGMSDARMFTDLDKVQKGDLILLHVLGDTLAYAVDTITVTDPADIEAIEIRQDKDLVTLVTCTPYSVNTHRLLVRGHRIELTEEEITEETKATEPEASTWMEKYIEGIFFGFIIGGAVLVLVRALSKKVRENQ